MSTVSFSVQGDDKHYSAATEPSCERPQLVIVFLFAYIRAALHSFIPEHMVVVVFLCWSVCYTVSALKIVIVTENIIETCLAGWRDNHRADTSANTLILILITVQYILQSCSLGENEVSCLPPLGEHHS